MTLNFPHGERFLFEVDFEPKAQFSGDDAWRGLDVTPAIEWSTKRWLEVVGETGVGRTKQSNQVSSVEVTPRIGIANPTRLEWRNLWYTDYTPSAHKARFRNRSDGTGLGGLPCPQRTRKPYEVYDAYEVFGPLRDREGTVWRQCHRRRVGARQPPGCAGLTTCIRSRS